MLAWIAAHTKPGEEFTAEYHLRRAGIATWLPWVFVPRKRKVRRGRALERREFDVVVSHDKRPFFSRYVFAEIDPLRQAHRVNRTPGVVSIVGVGDNPLEIPGDVMRELVSICKVDGEVVDEAERQAPPEVMLGDQVRVPIHDSYGRLVQNLIAEVVGVDRTGKIRIWSDSFRRPWTVERARVEQFDPEVRSVDQCR